MAGRANIFMTEGYYNDYYPGKGCQCYAHSESECACSDVDWTDPEVYKLRKENKELRAQIEELEIKLVKLQKSL